DAMSAVEPVDGSSIRLPCYRPMPTHSQRGILRVHAQPWIHKRPDTRIRSPYRHALRSTSAPMSLRARLSILVGAALVPPLALTAYNTVILQSALERQVNNEALSSARLLSAELAQLVEGGRQLMTALTNHPGVPDHEDECVPYFKAVISELPIYREA